MNIHKMLENVNDSKSFLEFAKALAEDHKCSIANTINRLNSSHHPSINEWENISLESFLESAVAWAEDSNFGISQGLLPSNPWLQFATFLYCGKIYE